MKSNVFRKTNSSSRNLESDTLRVNTAAVIANLACPSATITNLTTTTATISNMVTTNTDQNITGNKTFVDKKISVTSTSPTTFDMISLSSSGNNVVGNQYSIPVKSRGIFLCNTAPEYPLCFWTTGLTQVFRIYDKDIEIVDSTGKLRINNTDLLSSTTLGSSVINSSLKNFGTVSSLNMEGNINMGNNSLMNVTNINSLPVSTIARKTEANTFTQTNTFSSGVLNVNGNTSAKIRLTETGTPAIFDVISESTGFKIHNVQTTQDWVRINTDGFDIHETLPFTRGGAKALSKNRLEEAADPDANTDFNNGYAGGSMWYNDAKKKMFFNVKSDAGQAEWADYSIENLTFNDSATFETTYVTICSFMPDKAGVNAYDIIVNSGATKIDVRIYNLSEASTLCELTDINTTGNPDIRTLTPPSIPYFYPNQNFTYQLQIRSTDGNVVSILALRKR